MAMWPFRSTKSPIASGGGGQIRPEQLTSFFVNLNGHVAIQQ